MSYLVLARKWRPQSFRDLVGQDHVRRTLENAIAQGRVAHAFLFTGVRGVGKTTSARILAKALNCENGPTADPCLKCSACVDITSGADMDVRELDGASNNSVEDVRRLQEELPYRPTRDRFKIYIVDEVHMLSPSAWNAFLKTLEEPPPHIKFIFATTEVHKVPITILSRCQRYDFKMLSVQTIAARLRYVLEQEKIAADEGAVHLLAREAAGSMRDAMSLLDQAIAWAGDRLVGDEVARVLGVASRSVLDRLAASLVGGQPDAALRLVAQLVDNGYDLAQVARDLLAVLRDLVVARVCTEPGMLLDLSEDERRATADLANRASVDDLVRLHQGFARSFDDIVRSPAPRAGLEMALVRLARRPPLMPLDDLLERLADLERRLGGGTDPGGGSGGPEPGRGSRSSGRSTQASASSASSASPAPAGSSPSATVTPLPQPHASMRVESLHTPIVGATALAARFESAPRPASPAPHASPSPHAEPQPAAEPDPSPASEVVHLPSAAGPAPLAGLRAAPAPAARSAVVTPLPRLAPQPARPSRGPRPWVPALHDDPSTEAPAALASAARPATLPTPAAVPTPPAAVPAPTATVPTAASAVPNPAPAVPQAPSAVPNPTSAVPQAPSAVPNPLSSIPQAPPGPRPAVSGVPQASLAVPNPASAVPKEPSAVPTPAPAVPPAVPAVASAPTPAAAPGGLASAGPAAQPRPVFARTPAFAPLNSRPVFAARPGSATPPSSRSGDAPPFSPRPDSGVPSSRPPSSQPPSSQPPSTPARSPSLPAQVPAWRAASPAPAARPAVPPAPPAPPAAPIAPAGRPAGRGVRVQPGALAHDPTKPMPQPLPGVDFAVWRRLVDRLRDALPSLASLLERASPTRLDASGVGLAFVPHSFEATRIREPKYSEPLRQAARAELGPDVEVRIDEHESAAEALTLWRLKAAELWERREAMRKRVLAHPAVVAAIEELGAELRDVRIDADDKR